MENVALLAKVDSISQITPNINNDSIEDKNITDTDTEKKENTPENSFKKEHFNILSKDQNKHSMKKFDPVKAESIAATISEDYGMTSAVDTDEDSVSPTPEDVIMYDRYGFLLQTNLITESYEERMHKAVSIARGRQTIHQLKENDIERKDRVLLECIRRKEWEKLLKKPVLRKKRLKKEVKKGVVDHFRAKIWRQSIEYVRKVDKTHFTSLFEKCEGNLKKEANSLQKHKSCIDRDLHRTLPDHECFREEGVGQKLLSRVLICYAEEDSAVGYCQGMGFIASFLLLYFPEEEAYEFLFSLLNHSKYRMRELFVDQMPLVQLRLFQLNRLLKKFSPKLFKHLGSIGVNEGMYATHWIITVFAYNFPIELVLKVWDLFFLFGWKIFFKVAIFILTQEQNKLLSFDFEEVLEYLRQVPVMLNIKELITKSLKIPIKNKHLKRLELLYQKTNKTK